MRKGHPVSNYSLNERLDKISDQLGSLEETVRENRASVVELERVAGLTEQNQTGGHRRNLAIIAGFVVIALIAFAGWRNNDDKSEKIATLVHELDAQAQAAKAATTDARVTACMAFNRDAIDRLNNLLIAVRDSSTNPQAQAFIDSQIGPERNCTPDGIADYYANPQGPNAYLPITTSTQPGG